MLSQFRRDLVHGSVATVGGIDAAGDDEHSDGVDHDDDACAEALEGIDGVVEIDGVEPSDGTAANALLLLEDRAQIAPELQDRRCIGGVHVHIAFFVS